MEELFLRAVLAGDELDVIDHQHIARAEKLFEIHHLLFAQSLNEAIHELLGRQIHHAQFRAFLAQFPGNRVHQMRFTQSNAAIKEQRVERHIAALGHAARGGMGQFVWLADHEILKCETRIQRCAGQIIKALGSLDGRGSACLGMCCVDFDAGSTTRGFHREFNARYIQLAGHKLAQDVVAVIARDPIAYECRWRGECRNATFKPVKMQRFDPVRKIA